MSWWTQVSGAELGDGPADAVGAAFAELARNRKQTGDPRPNVADLIAAVEVAAGRSLNLARRPALVARLDDGAQVLARELAPEDVAQALAVAFHHARGDYLKSLDREPTVAELAATVAFVLGPHAAAEVRLPDGATGVRAIELTLM
jgi:hypothetical protein